MHERVIPKVRRIRVTRGHERDDPLPNTAFIFRSLKHPGEVAVLRKVYGRSFYLIGAYCPSESRRRNLAREIAHSHNSAREDDFLESAQALIRKDEAEVELPFGQRVRDAYPLADVFVDVDLPDAPWLSNAMPRRSCSSTTPGNIGW